MGHPAQEDPIRVLADLARRQHHAFTTRQARSVGWSEVAVAAARRSRAWRRLFRGVYVDALVWAALDRRAQHLCVVHGRTLALGDGWHAARRSGAIAHRLPLLGGVPTVPQLVRAPTARTGTTSRHERLASLRPEDSQVIDGLTVTSRARLAVDIARGESLRSAIVVADAALRAGTTREELVSAARYCSAWPNGLAAMRVAELADGLSESPLESISRVAVHELGFPAPELQVLVVLGDEVLARLDFLWRATNTIGQADGALKYTGKQDVLADKLQDERLEDLGFEVVRWPWAAAWKPKELLEEKLRRGMARGARQDLHPRVRLVPTTVEDNLRANARRTG
jgi:hypothetical protein